MPAASRWLTPLLLGCALLSAAAAVQATPTLSDAERLYRLGLLASGSPLRGERGAGLVLEGQAAACVSCHRRSGLGASEGGVLVPPIAGRYLGRPEIAPIAESTTLRAQPFAASQVPYTDATLARAIRSGLGADGRSLNLLMPRYDLDDATMGSLIDYLKGLAAETVPGVSETALQFATIITPDADPAARRGMLDVLRKFFAQQNVLIGGPSRPMHTTRNIMYRVVRKWQLHVWELSGPPDTWEQQLAQKLAAEPVFAIISGLAGSNWAPIHHFCERAALPCLFPNAELPVIAESDFYSVYYSRGVLLESDLIATRIRGMPRGPAARLIEVYRDTDVGSTAAAALRRSLQVDKVSTVLVKVARADASEELAAALRKVAPGDAVVLWLRPDDLRHLPKKPPEGAVLYVSGIMASLEEAPLTPPWRSIVQLTYPVDLPEARHARMEYPHRWFAVAGIPVVADRVQVDTYLACVILSEALGHMRDTFVRDYLVERLEVQLSHRIVNGYYPRLGLAPGQRFASKGGYMVHFAPAPGTTVVADGEWIVP